MDEAPATVVPERGAQTAAAGPGTAVAASPARRRRRIPELVVLALIGVLLIGAFATAGTALYREFYSPTAFVERYLELLAEGRAADALEIPGVDVDPASLEAAGLPAASDALLRRAALTTLTDVEVVSEETDGDITRVTVEYRAGDVDGRTDFHVAQDGWLGVAPAWRFATSPLTVMNVTVRGSMEFAVNDFPLDKRQVSPDGIGADPLAPVSLLVFSPGLYSVSVDTAISATPGAAVLADAPLADVDIDIQAEATEQFVGVVQKSMEDFLTACAAQDVLQPTGCPFGFQVRNRIVDTPSWSITQMPEVSVVPDGPGWRIERAEAVAHIDVEIRLVFDGSLRSVSEDVPFAVEGTIDVLPDGKASISVSGENL